MIRNLTIHAKPPCNNTISLMDFQRKLQLHNWRTSVRYTINIFSFQYNDNLMFNDHIIVWFHSTISYFTWLRQGRYAHKANFHPGSLRSHFFLPWIWRVTSKTSLIFSYHTVKTDVSFWLNRFDNPYVKIKKTYAHRDRI